MKLVALIALACVLWPSRSEAQSRSEDLRVSRQAFREGAESARLSRWPQAIAAFERSYRLRPHPVTSFNLGYAERAIGHLTRSIWHLERALTEDRSNRHGQLSESQRVSARNYLSEILNTVARVEITPEPSGVALSVDGLPLEPRVDRPGQFFAGIARDSGTTTASDPILVFVDPGVHIVNCSRLGWRDSTETLSLKAGQRLGVNCHLRRLPKRQQSPDHTVSVLVGGFGLATLSVGSVLGVAALAKQSDLDRTCPTRSHCDRESEGDILVMKRYADASTIAFTVGVSALAVSVWLWLEGSSAAPRELSFKF